MGMMFNNWLDEGYYEYNDFDGYSKVSDLSSVDEDNLYYSSGDGYGLTKVADMNNDQNKNIINLCNHETKKL